MDTTWFHVGADLDEKMARALVDAAADIGQEIFEVDAGSVQAFRIRSSHESKQLMLKGLDPASLYELTDPYANNTFTASGELLTSEGAKFTLPQMSSQVLMPTCLSIEWDVGGDSDHDATCGLEFRAEGTDEWRDALPLLRVDYQRWFNTERAERPFNMLAGSIMFLDGKDPTTAPVGRAGPLGSTLSYDASGFDVRIEADASLPWRVDST